MPEPEEPMKVCRHCGEPIVETHSMALPEGRWVHEHGNAYCRKTVAEPYPFQRK